MLSIVKRSINVLETIEEIGSIGERDEALTEIVLPLFSEPLVNGDSGKLLVADSLGRGNRSKKCGRNKCFHPREVFLIITFWPNQLAFIP